MLPGQPQQVPALRPQERAEVPPVRTELRRVPHRVVEQVCAVEKLPRHGGEAAPLVLHRVVELRHRGVVEGEREAGQERLESRMGVQRLLPHHRRRVVRREEAAVVLEQHHREAGELAVRRVRIDEVDLPLRDRLVGEAVLHQADVRHLQAVRLGQRLPPVGALEELVPDPRHQLPRVRSELRQPRDPERLRLRLGHSDRVAVGEPERVEPHHVPGLGVLALDGEEHLQLPPRPLLVLQLHGEGGARVLGIQIDLPVDERGVDHRRPPEVRLALDVDVEVPLDELRHDLGEEAALREVLAPDRDARPRVGLRVGQQQREHDGGHRHANDPNVPAHPQIV